MDAPHRHRRHRRALAEVTFDADGLVPAIVQEAGTGRC